MASEVKTNKISPATATTINVGDSGDTLALATDAVTGFNGGSDAQGDVLYHDGTDYTRLAAGTSGYYLKTQGTSANPVWADAAYSPTPMWFAYANSDQTGVSDATWTKVTNFGAEAIDSDGAYATGTQTFTVPADKAGKYYIFGSVIAGSGADDTMFSGGAAIYVDAVKYADFVMDLSSSAGKRIAAHVSAIIDLSVGEAVTIYGYGDINSGTPAFYSSGYTKAGRFFGWRLSA